jgi:hypothetical protein
MINWTGITSGAAAVPELAVMLPRNVPVEPTCDGLTQIDNAPPGVPTVGPGLVPRTNQLDPPVVDDVTVGEVVATVYMVLLIVPPFDDRVIPELQVLPVRAIGGTWKVTVLVAGFRETAPERLPVRT